MYISVLQPEGPGEEEPAHGGRNPCFGTNLLLMNKDPGGKATGTTRMAEADEAQDLTYSCFARQRIALLFSSRMMPD